MSKSSRAALFGHPKNRRKLTRRSSRACLVHGEDEEGQQVSILTVFYKDADGVIRLSWASELLFMPTEAGQDRRHVGTVEPMWTLLDLTPGGRPDADEKIEYECCRPEGGASE